MTAAPQRRIRTAVAATRAAALAPPPPPPAPPSRAGRTVAGTRQTNASAKRGGETYYETDQTEPFEGDTFPEGVEPALVRVNAGLTRNLGNYESLRLDVSVTLPSLPSQIDETYARAAQFVSDKLVEEEALWLGQGNSKAKAKGK